MLTGLSIWNVVLIDELELSFKSGLSILTGETGAGKSILLDCLGLALGARGDASIIPITAEKERDQSKDHSRVTAEFDLSSYHQNNPLWDFLEEQGINVDENKLLLLRRHLYRTKSSRAFVNDQLVSLKTLKQLGGLLIEVHNQFDHLFDVELHRKILDRFAAVHNNTMVEQLAQVSQAYAQWKKKEQELKSYQNSLLNSLHQEAFCRQVIQDLEPLNLTPKEEEILLAKRQTLYAYGKISQAVKDALKLLSHPTDVTFQLMQAEKILSRANQDPISLPGSLSGSLLGETLKSLEKAQLETQSVVETLKELAAQNQDSLQELERVEERLHTLRTLAKRYYVAVNDLYDFYDNNRSLLNQQHESEHLLATLQGDVAKSLAYYQQQASVLTTYRKKAADRLIQAINRELPELKLAQASFTIDFKAQQLISQPSDFGNDRVEFLISTNPGQPPGSFAKVASGGELSRFMLAFKVVLADCGANATLVFDEVDTGVGGAVAASIGQRLKKMSSSLQVLAITHLPQVAGYADHHYKVTKQIVDGRNKTTVIPLNRDQRQTELARMIAGETITAEAYAAANKLMQSSPSTI